MAGDGLAFHREIEAAVEQNMLNPTYGEGFTTLPVVGTRQRTLQSATLTAGRLIVSRSLPAGIDPLLGDGDGTVPRLSAIPIELSTEYQDTFVPERHSSLQNHGRVLQDIRDRIIHMQTRGLAAIRGPGVSQDASGAPGLSVDLDDLYEAEEPIIVSAEVVNGDSAGLTAHVKAVDGSQTLHRQFGREDDEFAVDLSDLEPGGYRLEVAPTDRGPTAPPPVHDVFIVAG